MFPDVGRSESPEDVGLSIGMEDTDSWRFFVGLCALIVTSSCFSGDFEGTAMVDLDRIRPIVLAAGEFSFRIGDPRRVGPGIDDCLLCIGVRVREGVRGEALVCFTFRCEESGRRGVCGDQVGVSSAVCNIFRSLSEERLFLRGGPELDGT